MKKISREELRDKLILGENLKLVEALPKKYWENSHIPGAVQMDLRKSCKKQIGFCLIEELK